MSEANAIDRPVRQEVIVIGCDRGGASAAVVALLQVLEHEEVSILDTRSLTLRKMPDLPRIQLLAPPKEQPICHGPQRKGRGGKLRRW